MDGSHEVTALLRQWASGDQQALENLSCRLYAELRKLAAGYLRNERPDHTLQPTALVNEAYVRLLNQSQTPLCQDRSQFFAIAARLMRQILVDHARRRLTAKRSGRKVSLDEAIGLPGGRSADLIALDCGLKELEHVDARKSKVVELRYFGGLPVEEIAEMLELSTKTVRRDLAFAEAWLYQQIKKDGYSSSGNASRGLKSDSVACQSANRGAFAGLVSTS
jgi:RNA polymerase sigma-70 factor, ECF subfamily